jgi:hypothetical protein
MRGASQKVRMAFCIGACALALSACDKLGIKFAPAEEVQKPAVVSTTIPLNFAVPIYLGADVKEVTEVPLHNKGKKGYSVRLETSDPVSKVNSYYAYTLTKAGWTARDLKIESYGLSQNKTLIATTAENQVIIAMEDHDGKTSILITLTPLVDFNSLK